MVNTPTPKDARIKGRMPNSFGWLPSFFFSSIFWFSLFYGTFESFTVSNWLKSKNAKLYLFGILTLLFSPSYEKNNLRHVWTSFMVSDVMYIWFFLKSSLIWLAIANGSLLLISQYVIPFWVHRLFFTALILRPRSKSIDHQIKIRYISIYRKPDCIQLFRRNQD